MRLEFWQFFRRIYGAAVRKLFIPVRRDSRFLGCIGSRGGSASMIIVNESGPKENEKSDGPSTLASILKLQ